MEAVASKFVSALKGIRVNYIFDPPGRNILDSIEKLGKAKNMEPALTGAGMNAGENQELVTMFY